MVLNYRRRRSEFDYLLLLLLNKPFRCNSMKKIYCLIIILLLPFLVQAQIITTSPAFLTNAAAEITFDATGTGLAGNTGDVFAHTGVITDKSLSTSDWKYASSWLDNSSKYKLVSQGNNKWKLTISPDIRTYYGVPEGEKIQKLAFVFRNVDGTKEGKDNGKDIFVDIHEAGLLVNIETPSSDQLVEKNTSMTVKANSSVVSTIRLLLDETELAKSSNVSAISYTYNFQMEGSHWLIAEAIQGTSSTRDSIYVTVKKDATDLAKPSNIRAGINYVGDNSVTLVLYAPGKKNVYAIGDFSNWKANNNYMMNRDGDYWWITITGLNKGQEYAFQYLVDGKLKVADPYTDKILDPWNDLYIPTAVYPNLKTYPSGKTEGIVSVFQPGQNLYIWKTNDYTLPEKDKMIIYELLIRDFTAEHSFTSTLAKLDYLESLGINTIELLPINEFEGNSSWGYNPSFYFAVDKYYGTKDTFKNFVDECHKRNIAVVIDMVLNHSFGQSPFVKLYWDEANNRPSSDNPWYNAESPNTEYSWGYDFNHESEQTKALVDSINSYWMKEYRVDGFRFDFTKGFTNVSGNGWAYDQSRIDILKRMASEIYKRNPSAIVILEHLTDNSEEKVLAESDILLWGNMNYNYNEATMGWTDGGNTDFSGAIYTKRGWSKPNLVAYMESHDEERLMYKALTYGNVSGNYDVKNIVTALSRAELAAAFYLTLPGPKMIWQFGELGYDYSINACSDGSTIKEDCRVAEKPIRWDYLDNANRKKLYNAYAKLIKLRKENKVFDSKDVDYSLSAAQKYIVWKGDTNAFLVGNFGVTEASVSLILPKSGSWYNAMTGESMSVSSTNYSIRLQPGEYKLYIDNGGVAGIGDVVIDNTHEIEVTDIQILYNSSDVKSMEVYNLSGNTVAISRGIQAVNISSLPPGAYIVKVKLTDKIVVRKFMKK